MITKIPKISKKLPHLLTKKEIDEHTNYLKNRLDTDKNYFLLILGGPTKNYDYSNENITKCGVSVERDLIELMYLSPFDPISFVDLGNVIPYQLDFFFI